MMMTTLAVALLSMQASGLPAMNYRDVATAADGSVYAVDLNQIAQRDSDGVPLRTGSVRITYSPAANEKTAEDVRGYRIKCGDRTAAVQSTVSTERGTGRVSMTRTKLAELEYRPLDRMDVAERSAIDLICAAPL